MDSSYYEKNLFRYKDNYLRQLSPDLNELNNLISDYRSINNMQSRKLINNFCNTTLTSDKKFGIDKLKFYKNIINFASVDDFNFVNGLQKCKQTIRNLIKKNPFDTVTKNDWIETFNPQSEYYIKKDFKYPQTYSETDLQTLKECMDKFNVKDFDFDTRVLDNEATTSNFAHGSFKTPDKGPDDPTKLQMSYGDSLLRYLQRFSGTPEDNFKNLMTFVTNDYETAWQNLIKIKNDPNFQFSHYKEFVEALFANKTIKAFTNSLSALPVVSNVGGKKKKDRKIKKTKSRKSKKKKRNYTRYRVSP